MNEKGKLWLKILAVAAVLVAVIAVVMIVEPLVGNKDKTIYKDSSGDNKLNIELVGTYTHHSAVAKVKNVIIDNQIMYNALPANPENDAYIFMGLFDEAENKYYFAGSKIAVEKEYKVAAVKLSDVKKVDDTLVNEYVNEQSRSKDCIFIGAVYKDGNNIKMYTNGTVISADELANAKTQYAFSDITFVDKNQDGVNDDLTASLPNMNIKNLSFAGWYHTSNFKNGTISSTNVSTTDNGVVYARYINYAEGGIIVLVCMAIVFLMLALLYGITSLLKYLAPKTKTQVKEEVVPTQSQVKPFTMEDITDEDMMVAALVATIDYHNECKEDVRVVSIKEIR